MKLPLFWQVGVIYTLTRVAINLSQIFMPFYIELFLGFGSGTFSENSPKSRNSNNNFKNNFFDMCQEVKLSP
jgi:hypothetical protein